MDNSTQQRRTLLSYQDSGYERLVIYLVLFTFSYLYIRLTPGSENGVPWYDKMVLAILFFSFFLSIFEGLFILNVKLSHKRIEFDEVNLHITSRRKETLVPLANVLRMDKLSSGTGSRGAFLSYEISFKNAAGNVACFYLRVYRKKTPEFERFANMARLQNPALEVKSAKTGICKVIKLLRKKKQAV